MLDRLIWNLVSAFIIRQLAKFQTSIDWNKVKADAIARIKDLVPGTWFDADAAFAVDYIIETLRIALSSPVLNDIVQDAVSGNHEQAAHRLKDTLLCAWTRECVVPKAKTLVLS